LAIDLRVDRDPRRWSRSLLAAEEPNRSTGCQRPVYLTPFASLVPISQVILFSSGVGYFQREGEINGNSQVELALPAKDVNDLLKSLVLQDAGGGKVTSITYDNQDPIEKTLQSFALDLTYNPTFGELLNQARGEKIEVALQTPGSPAGSLTGSSWAWKAIRFRRPAMRATAPTQT
jgi:hypothetical protein